MKKKASQQSKNLELSKTEKEKINKRVEESMTVHKVTAHDRDRIELKKKYWISIFSFKCLIIFDVTETKQYSYNIHARMLRVRSDQSVSF